MSGRDGESWAGILRQDRGSERFRPSAGGAKALYFDRTGAPIGEDRWGELFHDWKYKRVRLTETDRYRVSTVWIGLNHNWRPDDPPHIFETMISLLDAELEEHPAHDAIYRYATEADAIAGHANAAAEADAATRSSIV